jgi:hypothetical protein
MRERTPCPRAVIDALPDLTLLITTGMRNASIDLEAAKARASRSAVRRPSATLQPLSPPG